MISPIRVAIVEDDPPQLALASHTLRTSEGIEVVATYASGTEALAELGPGGTVEADVVVVDLGLPDMPGAEVARRIRARPHPPEIVVLTAHGERAMALEALKSGATGYLLKGSIAELPGAVRIAAEGGSAIAPAIARYLLDEVRVPSLAGEKSQMPLRDVGGHSGNDGSDPSAGRAPLTRREREVLALLAKGATYEDTARMLGISLGTVQSHVKSLYRKLEVSSKAEAAAEAVRRGLATP